MIEPDGVEPSLPGVATKVSDVRGVSLTDLAQNTLGLRRVIPPSDAMKAPVAAFDASL